jgi:uncharacterized protein DUF1206
MTSSPTSHPHNARGAARRVGHSEAVDRAARVGLAGRGLVYVLVGVLAAEVAFGHSERADQSGALQKVAEQPFGKAVLWLLVVGFAGYGTWKLSESVWGFAGETDARKRRVKRLGSLATGLFYLAFGGVVLRIPAGSGSGGGSGSGQKALTARVLGAPGGQALVVAAGLVVIGIAVGLTWYGLKTDFENELDQSRMSPATYGAVKRLGQVGYAARGVVFALVGIFVVRAALDHDPTEASGFDVALKSVAAAPFGRFLLLVAAGGLICFGVYSFADARYRRL